MTGTIVRLKLDKGYGFVRGADGVDRFFHRSAMPSHKFLQIEEGTRVTFVEELSDRGPRAMQIQIEGDTEPDVAPRRRR